MASDAPFAARLGRVRSAMADLGVEVALLSVGAELPWLCGYEAMPLERLTMLVVPRDGDATLVLPALEAPRVLDRPDVVALRPWDETEDPTAIVDALCGPARHLAIGDRTWARFLVELQRRRSGASWTPASAVVGPLRAVKDDHEVGALRRAAAAADRVVDQLRSGEVALVGRTEADVAADLGRRLLDEGHSRVNFAIVAAGEHAASPHHEPGNRVIGADEVVLCDIGGTVRDEFGVGYCSDITRCVWTGPAPSTATDVWEVLREAQDVAVRAVSAGTPAEDVDAAARSRISEAGYGPYFVHRTGHGIGVEEHEDPYVVEGNGAPLVVGNVFSVEPGIYLPGRFGFRLEDIVVVGADGPERLNGVDRDLAAVGP